jgi:hypothetical protein
VFGVIESKMRSIIKSYVNFVGLRLLEAFDVWLEANRDRIDPRLYNKFKRELWNFNVEKVKGIVDAVRWMQQALYDVNCYVLVGLDGYQIFGCDNYDKRVTARLAFMMYYALGLQRIPEELRD